MREAGRYLPEYLELRKGFPDFIKFCLSPQSTKEAALQPLRRFPLDVAILFSDILILPFALGQDVVFKEKEGPLLFFLGENFLNLMIFLKSLDI